MVNFSKIKKMTDGYPDDELRIPYPYFNLTRIWPTDQDSIDPESKKSHQFLKSNLQ